MTKEEKKEYDRQRYLKNREQLLAQKKRWNEEHKKQRAEYGKQYRQENKIKIKEYLKNNKAKINERAKHYRKTPMGRASYLKTGYCRLDKMANRGECTLTAKWIADNILSKHCHYCGESDWLKIGCDRIDNSKPHTEDNVVPCCHSCNSKKKKMNYDDFIKNGK